MQTYAIVCAAQHVLQRPNKQRGAVHEENTAHSNFRLVTDLTGVLLPSILEHFLQARALLELLVQVSYFALKFVQLLSKLLLQKLDIIYQR